MFDRPPSSSFTLWNTAQFGWIVPFSACQSMRSSSPQRGDLTSQVPARLGLGPSSHRLGLVNARALKEALQHAASSFAIAHYRHPGVFGADGVGIPIVF